MLDVGEHSMFRRFCIDCRAFLTRLRRNNVYSNDFKAITSSNNFNEINKITHLVITIDGSTCTIYKDSEHTNSKPFKISTEIRDFNIIGGCLFPDGCVGGFFKGCILCFRLWYGVVLEQREVDVLYEKINARNYDKYII